MFEPSSMALAAVVWVLGLAIMGFFAVRGHAFGSRSLKHVLTRLAGMLASTLVVVLAAVLTLNAQYGWYESWEDVETSITGQAPTIEQHAVGHPRTTAQKAEAMRKAARVDAEADAKFATSRTAFEAQQHLKASSTGQWIKINVPGIRMQGKDIGRVMVWLPPSYTAQPRRTYPVIEAFHGIPGGTLDYERVFHLDVALRDAMTRGAVRDAIIVVPQEMPGGIDTECVDGGGLDMETWLTQTVPDFITQHLRVEADRESWVTLGVSAGGWCASMASVLHPDRYVGGVSLGGYFSPQFDGWNPFGSAVPKRYDLVTQVREHPHPQSMWVLVSGADKLSGASSRAFIDAASQYDVTQVDLPHAGHRIQIWERTFPDVFAWMGRTLPAFAATPSDVGHSAPGVGSTLSTHGSHPGSTVPAVPSRAPGRAEMPGRGGGAPLSR